MPIDPRMAKRLARVENAYNCVDPYVWYRPVDKENQSWHFTVRGPKGSPFEGGVYHGRIVLPNNYPIGAPDFYFLTENGRYTINQKICLSISGFHLNTWQPATTIEAMVRMIQVFLEDYSENRFGVSYIETSVSERRYLAKKSRSYCCPICGQIVDHLAPLPDEKLSVCYYS
ncbi:ubiquitin-conjugating enzyme E2 [Blastocystis sp. subtype 4]|uniref:ubiquitin-conjugating enzyme E2 n=1 Tax=Blastocystis sp. subtype 4 TaxID=944170 RepID=UPI000711F3A9|nr:ubiquitin-conjugating enzyme E2 [Blastocystis sp. subtype 4]KNB43250.1 ubiquitin-conjugating enzyme E2 [Blastocystis sp. subtype 4]|eukprot:XP_014526704.1 ubiquitin-conjugating enzyme E2 [Blastocystis sp. subtype 4]